MRRTRLTSTVPGWRTVTGLALAVLSTAGCAARREPVEAAFPRASMAAPWILHDNVWTGPAATAADALGDDWPNVARRGPSRAWLAVYRHESAPGRALRVRVFELPTAEAARDFVDERREQDSKPLGIGDHGAWMDDGVVFARGRLVFEIIGDGTDWGSQLQAAYLAGCIEKRLARDAGHEPS